MKLYLSIIACLFLFFSEIKSVAQNMDSLKVNQDAIYFDEKSFFIGHFGHLIFANITKNPYWGDSHYLGWTGFVNMGKYIVPRYAARLDLQYHILNGKIASFPIQQVGYGIALSHQYQVFKRLRTGFYVRQGVSLFHSYFSKKDEILKQVNYRKYEVIFMSFTLGFESPLFRKQGIDNLYLNTEFGYLFSPTQGMSITGFPISFGLHYYIKHKKITISK
ncbi:MAG: hypothetical protein JJT94_17415 [Bernardetiaceae bacterium]|nr:hypothetical protein [Bernardetiaceae bacterium]